MIVLGVNHSHNAGVTLSVDRKIIFHIESERLNNIRYGWFPYPAIAEIKRYVDHIDLLVISGIQPVEKRVSLTCHMDAYTAFVKSLGRSFDRFTTIDLSDRHHLTHAASAYYGSGFDRALCIVKDGAGSDVLGDFGRAIETETSFIIDRDDISLVERRVSSPNIHLAVDNHTTVIPYSSEADGFSAIAQALGFGHWDAGKVMGLSAYGKESHYSFVTPLGVDRNKAISVTWDNFDDKANIAYAIQMETEKSTIDYILRMIEKTGIKDVALSGGLFQNCVMNYKILKALPDDARLYVEPLSNDAGTSIGAVDLIHREMDKEYRNKRGTLYLGGMSDYKNIDDGIVHTTPDEIALALSNRKIVAIFQGRSEAGTRALGNRSILYDPRDSNGKDRVNIVKKREWFRPFAGSVLHEYAPEWFDMNKLDESPYMLYAVDVKREMASVIPCITHVNGTCRIQTVKQEQNNALYKLIQKFYKITGVPILLNTSFNLAGNAIVETVEDAVKTFYESDIDVLYLPDIESALYK